ncbi:uracil-DNA glycosylase [Amaricoccus macauensis]|uniref:uracil-DNA glycosylase n=1 Tax=Amaricoccus macauensis TaxID=57001 RepID=UPI003C7C36AB
MRTASLPEAWREPLEAEGVWPELSRLADRAQATENIAPAPERIFRALEMVPPEAVRVVILGQDPYPTPGHANGLSFSVEPGVAPPRSLKNIYREMQDDLGVSPASHGDLGAWARQGVLLLNTVLTVELGQANAHAKWGWQTVTDGIIRATAELPQPVVYMLWGKSAEAKTALIGEGRHLILTAPHPSPLSARRGFFGCRHFSKANAWLAEQGQKPIDWALA